MSNVLSEEKQKQVIAVGQLGWTLRRIEKETGVRRETAAGYLRSAGVTICPPGRWGRLPPAKPAIEFTTDPAGTATADPANEGGVTTDPEGPKPANGPAQVTAGPEVPRLAEAHPPAPACRSTS